MKKIASILVILFCSGCAAIKYTPPTSGPIANILLKNDSESKLLVVFFEESSGCKRRRNIPDTGPNTVSNYSIYAGREFTFQYYLTKSTGTRELYCVTNLRFLPEPNHRYLFRTDVKENKCKWIMIDITNKDYPKPIKLDAIPWETGWDENSSFCKE